MSPRTVRTPKSTAARVGSEDGVERRWVTSKRGARVEADDVVETGGDPTRVTE